MEKGEESALKAGGQGKRLDLRRQGSLKQGVNVGLKVSASQEALAITHCSVVLGTGSSFRHVGMAGDRLKRLEHGS